MEFPNKGDIPAANLEQIERLLPAREQVLKTDDMEEVMLSDYDPHHSSGQVRGREF